MGHDSFQGKIQVVKRLRTTALEYNILLPDAYTEGGRLPNPPNLIVV